jgi:hypothetical protein
VDPDGFLGFFLDEEHTVVVSVGVNAMSVGLDGVVEQVPNDARRLSPDVVRGLSVANRSRALFAMVVTSR